MDEIERVSESTTLNLQALSGREDPMAGRPNSLILDESDGADAKSSIMALVNIIKSEKSDSGGSTVDNSASIGGILSKSKKKKKKNTHLRRPIIFICNHKYASALKCLLPYTRQFDVNSHSSTRLVSRLKAVLASELMSQLI